MTNPFTQGHEQVTHFHDPQSGLQAIVAIYSTALGPALGGTRMRGYPSPQAALEDALDLSRAMAYKNALAGLPHGGGKAVILADPQNRTPELILAYARAVESLSGRYVTACDVGTTVADMDLASTQSRYVTGRSPARGGAGDSGELTALGVYSGMRAAAQFRWGTPSLAGRHVGVLGTGKVGSRLIPLLLADGAQVSAWDASAAVTQRLSAQFGSDVRVVTSEAELEALPLEIYSPNALGGTVTSALATQTSASIICGGANNQLAEPDVADLLAQREVLYCPDFCVNAGGVIAVADEWRGYDADRARASTLGIFETTAAVLAAAAESNITPVQAAEKIAQDRIRTAQMGG